MRYKIDMQLARSRYKEMEEQSAFWSDRTIGFRRSLRRSVLFDMWNNGEINDRALLWVIEEGRLSDEIISEIFADKDE